MIEPLLLILRFNPGQDIGCSAERESSKDDPSQIAGRCRGGEFWQARAESRVAQTCQNSPGGYRHVRQRARPFERQAPLLEPVGLSRVKSQAKHGRFYHGESAVLSKGYPDTSRNGTSVAARHVGPA